MNTLWKTFCTALSIRNILNFLLYKHSAKSMFVHELRIAKTIFPKDYRISELDLSKLDTNNIMVRYNLLDSPDSSLFIV